MTPPKHVVVGVDLGKTGCRTAVAPGAVAGRGDPAEPVVQGPGAPGLAEARGLDLAFDAARRGIDQALGGRTPERIFLGVAGAEAAPEQAGALGRRLARTWPGAEVGVASDSVTAHAGAFSGGTGTVLAVGTGAVALGLARDGRRLQVDGWGPWLGDDGGGSWIGRAALRAVLRAADGRGPATVLTGLARARFGPLDALPRALAADAAVARATASFVPDVLAAAGQGDPVAADVLGEAVRCWADLATAAARFTEEPDLVLLGGLAAEPQLVDRLTPLLPPGIRVVPPHGTGLDGALLLARRTDLPHEKSVTRVCPADIGGERVPDLDRLATEQARADLLDLDLRDPADVVALLLEAEATVPAALSAAATELTAAVRLGAAALTRGGRLLYVGAGTPGRLAALDAAECPPTFGTAPDRVVAVLAGGRQADRRAVEGAEDDAAAGDRDLAALDVGADDLVVGISASGRTPYVLAALDRARLAGAATVAVVNNPDSPAAARADVGVELLTGAEVLSGSTRLKAGTAQKNALNALSTGAMVAAGRTYGPWMVDVVASNEKLRRRAQRILREAAGVGEERARSVLEEAGWHTKTALVALLGGLPVDEARARLEAAGGRVRDALPGDAAHSGEAEPAAAVEPAS